MPSSTNKLYNRYKQLPLSERLKGLLRDLRSSIVGHDQDYTSISINRAILLLSIPMIIEMAMEAMFALADIIFVSELGSDAVSVVGITESMMTIVYAFGIGLSVATTAVIARRIGEKKPEDASVAAVQAILIGVFTSLPFMLTGILFSKELLMLMGTTTEVAETYSDYTSWLMGSNLVIMLLFIINAIFRSAGDAAISMWILALANGINIILDPCLIFGLGPFPELGLKGAAIATFTGRGLAVLTQLAILLMGKKRIQIRLRHLVLNLGVILKIFKLSIGSIGQYIIATSSWIGLVRIISEFGSDALAGYTIAIRVVIFSILPAWGFSNATSTLVGQNLGAGKPDRAEKSVWRAAWINVFFMIIIGVIIFIFSERIMMLFIDEPEVIKVGTLALTIMSVGYLFYALGMVMPQAFNGAGDTATPTWINLICFYLIEIPLAYVLALRLGFEETGVFYSIIIAEACMAILSAILFKRGKWKTRMV